MVVGSTTLPELDNKTLNFNTVRTAQERDIDCRPCKPNAPGPQVTLGRTWRVQRPIRRILKTCAWYPLGLSCQHRPYEVSVPCITSPLPSFSSRSGRQGPTSTRKVQSNLLASVLVLTVVPTAVKVSQAAIDHCCFLICQKLVVDEVDSL